MTPKNAPAAFNEFDEELNLAPPERQAAERRHHQGTECLVAAGLAVATLLQVSFAPKNDAQALEGCGYGHRPDRAAGGAAARPRRSSDTDPHNARAVACLEAVVRALGNVDRYCSEAVIQAATCARELTPSLFNTLRT